MTAPGTNSEAETNSPANPPITEGQRLLLAAGSGSEVVAKTGLAKGSVSEWRRAVKVPGAAARKKLAEVLGIPPSSWEVAPGAATEGPATDAPRRGANPTEDMGNHVEAIRQSLEDKTLSPAERTRRMVAYTQAVRAFAEVRSTESFVETRIVLEHPAFHRAVKTILRTLKHHPELAREIAEALEHEELAFAGMGDGP